MIDIEIRIPHAMPLTRARKQADRVAIPFKERFAADCTWSGNTLHFSRQGVAGTLDVTSTEVTVRVKLGLLFRFLKPQIEKQIRHNLSDVFGSPPVAAAKPTAVKKVKPARTARSPKSPGASKARK